jgi:homoserine dehydrogenase
VDGIDAARKVVIMANSLFNKEARLEDVQIEGIRNVEPLVRVAAKTSKKTKLICKITKDRDKLRMSVMPQQIPLEDPLATVNHGDMGIKFTFTTSKDIFVSAQFKGPTQTAYAVLNDIIKLGSMRETC